MVQFNIIEKCLERLERLILFTYEDKKINLKQEY